MTIKYKVSDHVFGVEFKSHTERLLNVPMAAYAPFVVNEGEPLFMLHAEVSDDIVVPGDFEEESRQDEEGQIIISGKTAEGDKVFVYQWGLETAYVISSPDYHEATLIATPSRLQHAIDNTLMLLFALATSNRATLLFHSSTVVWEGKAFLFLGISGTGKSTHSRLWLDNIPGTHLLNDDNPAVRLSDDGTATAYGTPWSGKTPCYRNEQYPVAAIVQLRQFPKNIIRRMTTIEAYVSIMESVSGKRWETVVADGLHASIERLIGHVPVYHLDCLPDADAALTCWKATKDRPTK